MKYPFSAVPFRVATVLVTAGWISLFGVNVQAMSLETTTGNTLGFSLSGYEYKEPGVMKLEARKLGFDYSGTYAFPSNRTEEAGGWFVLGQARYATGKADYTSPISGSLNNTTNWYYELRGYIGRDYVASTSSFSPLAGVGYRYLYNDLRGISSAGDSGYRRENTYLTLSLGFMHTIHFSEQARYSTMVEYLHLIEGKHTARLSDSGPRNNLTLKQKNGYGLRIDIMRHFGPWSVGPSLRYWNIGNSEVVAGLIEPKNTTTEFGLRAAYRF